MNISTTSRPIPTKFYLKHHFGGGKAASGFGPDRIGWVSGCRTDKFRSLSLFCEMSFRSLNGSVTPLDLQDHGLDQFIMSSSRYLRISEGLPKFVESC